MLVILHQMWEASCEEAQSVWAPLHLNNYKDNAGSHFHNSSPAQCGIFRLKRPIPPYSGSNVCLQLIPASFTSFFNSSSFSFPGRLVGNEKQR